MELYRLTPNNNALLRTEHHLTDRSWELYEQALNDEAGLIDYPVAFYKERFKKNQLIALINDDKQIVAAVSLASVLTETMAHTLGIKGAGVYLIGGSWIHNSLRGKKIYSLLRDKILERLNDDDLCLSQTLGRGASGLNMRKGWKPIAWSHYPYASSLVGWQEKVHFRLATGRYIKSMPLFNQDHIPDEYDWRCQHLWASDRNKIDALEALIKQKFSNLPAWRRHIISERTDPVPSQGGTNPEIGK